MVKRFAFDTLSWASSCRRVEVSLAATFDGQWVDAFDILRSASDSTAYEREFTALRGLPAGVRVLIWSPENVDAAWDLPSHWCTDDVGTVPSSALELIGHLVAEPRQLVDVPLNRSCWPDVQRWTLPPRSQDAHVEVALRVPGLRALALGRDVATTCGETVQQALSMPLTELRVLDAAPGAAWLSATLASAAGRTLAVLDPGFGTSAEHAVVLAGADLPALRALSLTRSNLSASDIDALAGASWWRGLRSLELLDSWPGAPDHDYGSKASDDAVDALLRALRGSSLAVLDVGGILPPALSSALLIDAPVSLTEIRLSRPAEGAAPSSRWDLHHDPEPDLLRLLLRDKPLPSILKPPPWTFLGSRRWWSSR